MSVASAQVSVGTSATALNAAGDADRAQGLSLTVLNPSANSATVFLGGSSVTTSGFGLPVGASVSMDLAEGEIVYGIVASGTQTVHVLRTGV